VPHKIDQLKLGELVFGADYYNHTKIIPKSRASGEEEWAYKSSALPGLEVEPLTTIYSLPVKVPAHHFIHDNHAFRRYKNYHGMDEKDPE
jgi:hypothetical protein